MHEKNKSWKVKLSAVPQVRATFEEALSGTAWHPRAENRSVGLAVRGNR